MKSVGVQNIIDGDHLNFNVLERFLQRPEPFASGEKLFWNDPHISKGMLAAHLNPAIDAASRRPETIEKTVNHMIRSMNLKAGDKILDLGCGPGLYCKHFAQQGFSVTGVDYSQRSIEYAEQAATDHSLDIEYKYMDYLDMNYCDTFDAVLLIYGDFCVISDKKRDLLLRKIHKALKPDGYFALDVSTKIHRKKNGLKNRWYAAENGFWKPEPHLVLENGFDYPEENLYLDQYLVIEKCGKISVYRNWFHDYSLGEIREVLEAGSFSVQSAWSDLTGKPYKENSEWIGIVAKKESLI
ncbi:class I SAM-dependent methyltransferase [Geosporobacter ferrireducens]|uniref:class I SAM-dependent methyltransferase n=1 Tax=Geosporobacter ferrireducens TaxID=1424294 RepID=UPI0009F1E436|nr:class I SAM-dependent methyltransferase [Geosporobacter ferrireducens]MTI57808.1 class I SAM-dependent methyltransferase [Geosporobacter ferrireducens]